jgi:hypothetical protein
LRWAWRPDQERWDKPPLQASNPHLPAKSNDPATWGSYTNAVAAVAAGQADGIGYMLADDDLDAVDLDHCRDPHTGEVAEWAQAEIDAANSYAEVTVSGMGLRILGIGSGGRASPQIQDSKHDERCSGGLPPNQQIHHHQRRADQWRRSRRCAIPQVISANCETGFSDLAPAAYNAGPGRVSAWFTSHRPLPGESRNYVAIVTGWTTDEWASESPPQTADTTIPQGVPCSTRLANLILAPKETKRIATYIPRRGLWLAAPLMESKAWAISVFTKNGVRCSDGNAGMASRD